MIYYIIFFIVAITLAIASYFDIRTRKVPVKVWVGAAYAALPLSLLTVFYTAISNMWKNIPINIPYGLFYSIIIIVLFYIISSISEKYIPKLKMGGADFIAISIVLISSLPVHQNFALLYVKYFIAASLLSILASVLYNRYYKKGDMFTYILPLIVPITIAYYALMVTFFVNGDVTFLIK